MEALLSILSVILLLIATELAFIAVFLFRGKHSMEKQSLRLRKQIESLHAEKAAETLAMIGEAVKRLSIFASGIEKIAAAEIEAITRLEASVTEFTRLSFGLDAGSARGRSRGFAELAEETEIDNLVRNDGMDRNEAKEQVRRDRMYNIGAG